MNENRPSIESIFLSALERSDLADRAEFLCEVCGDDDELRNRVQQLLDANPKVENFLEPASPELNVTEAPDSAECSGATIGPYKLLQQIGEGGMGVVYMAEQKMPVKRRVALKVIKPGMGSQQVIARFEAERQALAMMDHPNIAKVLDAGTTDQGQPYFVMELVRGTPITAYCDQQKLAARDRLELLISVCRAVQHAHQKGIIHRDLKPTNVLVAQYDDRPVVKVIDFGVAKALNQELTERTMFTRFGQVVGTLEYMSPEQATFNQLDVDTRSDVYSLGVIMYELLTGVTPLDKERIHVAALDDVMRIIREEEPPRPSVRLTSSETLANIAANRGVDAQKLTALVRGELDWIAMRALEKDRSLRYESASALAADMERYLIDQPVDARPPSAAYRLKKRLQRHKVAFLAGAGALVLLLLGIAGTTSGWFLAVQARDDAVETLRQVREHVIQRILSPAFSGDVEKVRSMLNEYENVLGDDDEWRHILEATASLHRGDYGRAEQLLKPIVQRSNPTIPAIAVLSTAYSEKGDWEACMRLRNRLQSAGPGEDPSDLDRLFLAYGLNYLDTRRAARILEDVLDDHPDWLVCHTILANLWTHLAADGNEVEIQDAVRRSTATAELANESWYALSSYLYTLRTAIEFRQREKVPYDDLERPARDVADQLREHPEYVLGYAMCAQFYDTIDEPGAEDIWKHVLENGAEMWRWTALARLYRDRTAEEVLTVLEGMEGPSTDSFVMAAKAYLLADVPGGRSKALQIYEELVAGEPSSVQCYNAVHILLLLGEGERAREASREWLRDWANRSDPSDNTESEMQETVLLRMIASGNIPSLEGSGRFKKSFVKHIRGLMAIADGDRVTAERFLRESIEKPHLNIDHYWGEAFLRHMREDENWPRENVKMKVDGPAALSTD